MAARLPGRKTGQPKERGRNKFPMLLCVTRKISRNALASGSECRTTLDPDASAFRLMSLLKSGSNCGPVPKWIRITPAPTILRPGDVFLERSSAVEKSEIEASTSSPSISCELTAGYTN